MIYVFKTSVAHREEVLQLKPFLNGLLQRSAWSFDLEDCDRILRIETETESPEQIIGLLVSRGFDCSELTD